MFGFKKKKTKQEPSDEMVFHVETMKDAMKGSRENTKIKTSPKKEESFSIFKKSKKKKIDKKKIRTASRKKQTKLSPLLTDKVTEIPKSKVTEKKIGLSSDTKPEHYAPPKPEPVKEKPVPASVPSKPEPPKPEPVKPAPPVPEPPRSEFVKPAPPVAPPIPTPAPPKPEPVEEKPVPIPAPPKPEPVKPAPPVLPPIPTPAPPKPEPVEEKPAPIPAPPKPEPIKPKPEKKIPERPQGIPKMTFESIEELEKALKETEKVTQQQQQSPPVETPSTEQFTQQETPQPGPFFDKKGEFNQQVVQKSRKLSKNILSTKLENYRSKLDQKKITQQSDQNLLDKGVIMPSSRINKPLLIIALLLITLTLGSGYYYFKYSIKGDSIEEIPFITDSPISNPLDEIIPDKHDDQRRTSIS